MNPLISSFTGIIEPTLNYAKHCNLKSGKVTGSALRISSSPYAVIDVDITKSLPDNTKEELRDLFSFLNKVKLVKTGSGGLHIYTKWDSSFPAYDDSYLKVVSSRELNFGIDVFVPFHKDGKSSRCIVLPGTQAKDRTTELIGTYELLVDCTDDELSSFSDVRAAIEDELGIKFDLPIIDYAKYLESTLVDPTLEEPDAQSTTCEMALQPSNSIPMTKKLFDAIVEGFDKNVTIHNDCSKPACNEVAILNVISGLNACIGDDITQDDVDKAIDRIYANASLTDTARARWFEQIFRNKSTRADHYGVLTSIIKHHNPEYYNKHLKPLFNRTPDSSSFLTDRYTISDFKRSMCEFTTYNDYINNLVKCLAFIDNGKYIIKEKDDDRVKYTIIDKKKLSEVFNFEGKYTITHKTTQADIDKAQEQKKKLPKLGKVVATTKQFNIIKELRDVEVHARFKHFEKAALISNDENIFSQFRPPTPSDYYIDIKEDPQLVDKFFTLINDQLYDDNAKESFEHFVNANAYLLQHGKKPEVYFIKFSQKGHTGKNYIDNAFTQIYGDFAIVGITGEQATEKHNGYMANTLYRALDEIDNATQNNNVFNNNLKRATNKRITIRAMGTDTTQNRDYAINSLNTNDPYIKRDDKAVISRLCIIRMRERPMKDSTYADFIDVIDEPNFGYSLYKYLMRIDLKAWVKNRCYDRYPLDKTTTILNQLTELKSTMLSEFIDSIHYRFEQKKYKGQVVDVIKATEIKDLYDDYALNNRLKPKSSSELASELTAMGFNTLRSMWFKGTSCSVYYRPHTKKKQVECEYFDDELPNAS